MKSIEGQDIPIIILGDPAYPDLPWLLRPFKESQNITREMRYFNYRLSTARMLIELTFGQLKGRWRCLGKRNESHVEFMPLLTTACCTLHNFCIDNEDPFRRENLDLPEDFDVFEHIPDSHDADAPGLDDMGFGPEPRNLNAKDIKMALVDYFWRNRNTRGNRR